jgi:hypothetical protein
MVYVELKRKVVSSWKEGGLPAATLHIKPQAGVTTLTPEVWLN